MTTRRNALLSLPLACAALSGFAQAPKAGATKRLGVLALEADSPVPPPQRPFYVELRHKGWILGENLLREPAYADWKVDRLPGYAEALVRKRVDAILALGQEAAVAAARATTTIPIVFANVSWPQEVGLIESDARPGRNATGWAFYAGIDVGMKRVQFLREILPKAKRVAWLLGSESFNIETVSGGRWSGLPTLEAGAGSLGLETEFFAVSEPQDLDSSLARIVAWRADAISAAGWQVWLGRQRLFELLLRHRLPSAFIVPEMVAAGGLLAYSPARGAGTYATQLSDFVDRVLRGTPAGELPVERPRRYELVINLKTADALGLKIPQSLLIQASELIR